MPGVTRPYTLVDILATINGPGSQGTTTSTNVVTGLGIFVEPDETIPLTDSVSTTVAAPATWDNGIWGGTQWH